MVSPKRKGPRDEDLSLVYLDHNILDAFLKNKLKVLKEDFTQNFQAVYSHGTLEEIKRAGQQSQDYAVSFLDQLVELNAAFIHVKLDSKFYDTNQIQIDYDNAHTIYRQYCDESPKFAAIRDNFKQFGFKCAGGRQGDTLEDVSRDSIKSFKRLMDYLDEQIKLIEPTFPKEAEKLRKRKAPYLAEMGKLSKSMNENMGKYIDDEKTWSAIKDFRQHFRLEPHHFNAIKPPKVLEKIWTLLNKSNCVANYQAGIDEFFMFNRSELIPNMTQHLHHKVLGGYNMLNTIGYYPDKPLHKERGFERASSDQIHASLASFCSCLITADERMAKKAEAIYEYLKVPTKVLYIDKVV